MKSKKTQTNIVAREEKITFILSRYVAFAEL